jgi:hypothetical protein
LKTSGWIPIDKNLASALPKDRPFTQLEAMFSLSLDYACDKFVTASGYAKLWKWNRKKVVRFFDQIGAAISYPEDSRKKQNQKGQITGQIRDRSGTDKGQITAIDSKWLNDQKDRKRTDKGQIRDRSRDTTSYPKNPNPNPKKKKEKKDALVYSDEFETFWKTYPKRKGRRPGKGSASLMFEKIPLTDRESLTLAVNNYSQECNGLPKDAERFLRNEFWKDFVEPKGRNDCQKQPENGASGKSGRSVREIREATIHNKDGSITLDWSRVNET